jgi:SAM-dependent methyltransferase
MLREARSRVPRARGFVHGDVVDLPLRDGFANALLAMHMLYHARDMDRAVSELRRALRDGGTLVVSTIGTRHLAGLRDLVRAELEATGLSWPSSGFRFDPALLERHFRSVVGHDLTSEVRVPEVEPVARYLASSAPFYETRLPDGAWGAIAARVAAVVSSQIAETGRFRFDTHVRVLVCH